MFCTPARVFFTLQLLWAIFVSLVAIVKILFYGIAQYAVHLTNWSWTFNALFYFVTLPFLVSTRARIWLDVRCAGSMVAVCFFPLNALVWSVAVTVFVLLITDAQFITDLFTDIDPGVVIVANSIFHTVPVLALAIFAALQHQLIYYGLNKWFAGAAARTGRCSWCAMLWLVLYQVWLGTLLVVGLYFVVLAAMGTSTKEIYDTEIAFGAGLLMFIGVAAIVNGVPLLMLVCCYRLTKPPKDAEYAETRVYTSDSELLDDLDQLASLIPPTVRARTSRFTADGLNFDI